MHLCFLYLKCKGAYSQSQIPLKLLFECANVQMSPLIKQLCLPGDHQEHPATYQEEHSGLHVFPRQLHQSSFFEKNLIHPNKHPFSPTIITQQYTYNFLFNFLSQIFFSGSWADIIFLVTF